MRHLVLVAALCLPGCAEVAKAFGEGLTSGSADDSSPGDEIGKGIATGNWLGAIIAAVTAIGGGVGSYFVYKRRSNGKAE